MNKKIGVAVVIILIISGLTIYFNKSNKTNPTQNNETKSAILNEIILDGKFAIGYQGKGGAFLISGSEEWLEFTNQDFADELLSPHYDKPISIKVKNYKESNATQKYDSAELIELIK